LKDSPAPGYDPTGGRHDRREHQDRIIAVERKMGDCGPRQESHMKRDRLLGDEHRGDAISRAEHA
jgi:hypothetical protein